MKRIMITVLAVFSLSTQVPSMTNAAEKGAVLAAGSVALAAEKREVAHALAIRDSALRADLVSRLNGEGLAVDLTQWLAGSTADATLRSSVKQADYAVRARKGIDREVGSLLQVRIAHASMLAKLRDGVEPLYAYEPDGNDSQWQFIEAFDRFGGVHQLDVHQMPEQPVLVVDIDSRKDLAAGLKVMRRSLALLSGREISAPIATLAATTPVTMLDRIRLNDDQEPWISGAAEIYALIAGVDPSRDQPALDIVDMPYLDNDGRDYFPNQILIFWDRYRWAAADVILMEHDDNTNYQTLISNLFSVASQILSALGQPTIGSLVALGSGLIENMPGHWFTNDDDYTDSYYTLEKDRYYTNHPGARGNALMSLRPHAIVSQ